jgi:small subunit ribosomal protein S1
MGLKKEREQIKNPIYPDESWWAAVLEDVEARCEPKKLGPCSRFRESNAAPYGEFVSTSGLTQEKDEAADIDWEWVKELYEGDDVIQLEVAKYNKGGLLVQGDGIQGFVPASHLVELSKQYPAKDRENALSDYAGRSLKLKVIECDQEQGRIVLSERAAQAEPGKRLELLGSLKEGDRITGRVTTITDFGVFVDLGGIEGLIHISELSWGRVCHPGTVVALEDEIEVYVLNIDSERARVALSLKRLNTNPWETAHERYTPGKITQAIITNIVSFGAFARLEDGLDGLIHISEFSNQLGNQKIKDILNEGQQVQVCVLHIDSAQQRLGLSLHSMEGNET